MLLLTLNLVLMAIGYWLVDLLVRRDGARRALTRIGVRGDAWWLAILVVGAAAGAAVLRWEAVPDASLARMVGLGLASFLVWKAVTEDIDPVAGVRHRAARWVLLACLGASFFAPSFLLVAALLLTTPFGVWQHHATMPMRMLQACIAFITLSALCAAVAPGAIPFLGRSLPLADAGPLIVFLVIMQVSHYLITAFAKGFLGPRWYSWMVDNRLHYLATSAYSWGWARFIPWNRYRHVIRAIRTFEKPMQVAAFSLEALAPLALLHPYAAAGFCGLWMGLHLGIFLTAGLLFWEWILADAVVLAAILMLDPAIASTIFGPIPALIGLAFVVVFPLRHKLWKPMPLGWWDTPFTQRMRWFAHGESGKVYEVRNNFMRPHERIYGKVHGCFLAPTAVCTYHLGEVWKHDLRDALKNAGPDLSKLELVREQFGIRPKSDAMAERHRRYIRRFFDALNQGADKHFLPRWLLWLRAPGGQLYYWGETEAYRGQEPVTKVVIRYREEYFDGSEHVRLRDEVVDEIEIGPCDDPQPATEPSPKELDDFLLGHAVGRLIELPKFADGYVKGDDGRPARV